MSLQRISSGAPWEKKVGYCRAVRAGNFVAVSGTTSMTEDGEVHGIGDAEAQAARCLELIDQALNRLGMTRDQIIRTRMFVTDIQLWEAFGRAHAAFFGEHRPAASMIEIAGLIDSKMLIEIEADAVADNPSHM